MAMATTYLAMNHQLQNKSTNCGQTCVAMITGKSIDEIEFVLGHPGGTRTADLKKLLATYGFKTGARRELWKWGERLPDLCILNMQIIGIKNCTHWAVYHDGYVYDPAHKDGRDGLSAYRYHYSNHF